MDIRLDFPLERLTQKHLQDAEKNHQVLTVTTKIDEKYIYAILGKAEDGWNMTLLNSSASVFNRGEDNTSILCPMQNDTWLTEHFFVIKDTYIGWE